MHQQDFVPLLEALGVFQLLGVVGISGLVAVFYGRERTAKLFFALVANDFTLGESIVASDPGIG